MVVLKNCYSTRKSLPFGKKWFPQVNDLAMLCAGLASVIPTRRIAYDLP